MELLTNKVDDSSNKLNRDESINNIHFILGLKDEKVFHEEDNNDIKYSNPLSPENLNKFETPMSGILKEVY